MCIKKQALILQAGEERVRKLISAVGVLLPLGSALCFVSEKVVRGQSNTMPFYRWPSHLPSKSITTTSNLFCPSN